MITLIVVQIMVAVNQLTWQQLILMHPSYRFTFGLHTPRHPLGFYCDHTDCGSDRSSCEPSDLATIDFDKFWLLVNPWSTYPYKFHWVYTVIISIVVQIKVGIGNEPRIDFEVTLVKC